MLIQNKKKRIENILCVSPILWYTNSMKEEMMSIVKNASEWHKKVAMEVVSECKENERELCEFLLGNDELLPMASEFYGSEGGAEIVMLFRKAEGNFGKEIHKWEMKYASSEVDGASEIIDLMKGWVAKKVA